MPPPLETLEEFSRAPPSSSFETRSAHTDELYGGNAVTLTLSKVVFLCWLKKFENTFGLPVSAWNCKSCKEIVNNKTLIIKVVQKIYDSWPCVWELPLPQAAAFLICKRSTKLNKKLKPYLSTRPCSCVVKSESSIWTSKLWEICPASTKRTWKWSNHFGDKISMVLHNSNNNKLCTWCKLSLLLHIIISIDSTSIKVFKHYDQ